MHFDETVHLAAVGGGFLRTPFLTATQEAPTDPRPGQMPVLSPQIIHIPSAGRKSGLNLHDPAFRRAVFSSTLCKTLTRDAAAQANQEGAGITFGFNDSPNRNMAKARLSTKLRLMGDTVLLLDDSGIRPNRPIDVNVLQPDDMSVGFLVFVSRYWQDLRHVDSDILLRHHIPLQFDCDFDTIPLGDSPFRAFLPIIGNQGTPIVYDAAFGPSSYNLDGTTPITGEGTVEIVPDGQGGFLIDLKMNPLGDTVIALTLADPSGQIFSRNIVVKDGWPAGSVLKFPHGMVGVPYYFSLPCNRNLCEIFGATCNSTNMENYSELFKMPDGLHFSDDYSAIVGTPTEYGTNFGIVPTSITEDVLQNMGLNLTINRPPRTLLNISDILSNDQATGEYYAAQFMPFGSILTYGGHAYEFRRFLSNNETWPGIKQTPYLYGAASRQSSVAQEGFWREMV